MPEHTLYWFGNECENVTGGWVGSNFITAYSSIGQYEKNTNSMRVYLTQSLTDICLKTANQIDLSNKSALKMHFTTANVPQVGRIYTTSTIPIANPDGEWYQRISTGTNLTISDDITSFNDSRYVCFGIWGSETSHTATVDCIWLE